MIPNLYNSQGFYWFVGVVENRHDPLHAGRCQVRVFGDHPSDKELLPTKDLPWAVPMMPITSASISGKGTAPIGPLEGTWVVGFYLDGPDKQMPMMIGTIGTSTLKAPEYKKVDPLPTVTNPLEEEVKKKAEAEAPPPKKEEVPAPEKQPEPEKQQAPVPVRKEVPGWVLGKTSEKYESGGKGPGVINDYNGKASGDYGGASYGCYQFASYLPPVMPSGKSRPASHNSPLAKYVKGSRFRNRLLGIKPATPEFDAEWKAIAKEYPEEFKEDQHEFIKKNYYDVLISNLKRVGFDLSGYGPAVQDLIWSTAVQLGPGNTEVFTTPLKGKPKLSDADIVSLVSTYKIERVPSLFASSTPAIQKGVTARYASEQKSLETLIT